MNCIDIKDKKACTGCEACYSRCPKSSITMLEDAEGFVYPIVNKEECIDCGICQRVCHELHQPECVLPLECIAVKSIDENVRKKSSSGGVFTLLSSQILKEGGVVFGARFNDKWQVVMDFTDNQEGLGKFRGSKYVQASVGNTLLQVEGFLKEGRTVLYTGTHCQISALRNFLGKDYSNLLAVDFLCHGVPSPMLWKKYLEEISSGDVSKIKSVNFRDKSIGWKDFQFVVQLTDGSTISEVFSDNIYMKAFLSDMSLRPSCYRCKSRNGHSGSDITIGDHWAIQDLYPLFDDDKGTSLVLVNTEKGKRFWNLIKKDVESMPTSFEASKKWNGAFYPQTEEHLHRQHFFRMLLKRNDVTQLAKEELVISFLDHVKKYVGKILKRQK